MDRIVMRDGLSRQFHAETVDGSRHGPVSWLRVRPPRGGTTGRDNKSSPVAPTIVTVGKHRDNLSDGVVLSYHQETTTKSNARICTVRTGCTYGG